MTRKLFVSFDVRIPKILWRTINQEKEYNALHDPSILRRFEDVQGIVKYSMLVGVERSHQFSSRWKKSDVVFLFFSFFRLNNLVNLRYSVVQMTITLVSYVEETDIYICKARNSSLDWCSHTNQITSQKGERESFLWWTKINLLFSDELVHSNLIFSWVFTHSTTHPLSRISKGQKKIKRPDQTSI